MNGMAGVNTITDGFLFTHACAQMINVIGTSPRQTGNHGNYKYNDSWHYPCNADCLDRFQLFCVANVPCTFDIGITAACCARLSNGTGPH
jgi:hypothetical protein